MIKSATEAVGLVELSEALRSVVYRLAGLLRTCDVDRRVSVSDWTIGKTAEHVAVALDFRPASSGEGTVPFPVERTSSRTVLPALPLTRRR
ncbi:MAG: hypothetical protein WD627_00965 [Actinomycetota bacterium]